MYLVVLSLLIIYLIYKKIIQPSFYWKERGVAHKTPWPFLGNMASSFFKRKSMFQQSMDFYNDFPDKRYNGAFQFTRPMLVVRDLDLLKQIMVKDFDHFTDHNSAIVDNDPLMARHLFAMKGQKWRNMRATVSPSFTSSKMRYMFSIMQECVVKFTSHLETKASPTYVTEIRDLYFRFTNDSIASIVFGYNCDSIAEPENEFFLMGKKSSTFSAWQMIKFFIISAVPSLAKLFGFAFFPKSTANFFRKVVKDNIEKRLNEGIVRPDMIQLLMDARSGQSKHTDTSSDGSVNEGFAAVQESHSDEPKDHSSSIVTDDDITTQAFVFFIAGFEAVATFLCFVSYELAINVETQEKLQAEIDETLRKCEGKITYTALLEMKYLDMVVTETLRKWGLGFQIDRVCTKDYEIKPSDASEKPLLVEKGTLLFIPVNGIHMDPKHYPNPEKFDPERFNEEKKREMNTFAYIPFGAGPRNCIASRFALLKSKTLLFNLLSKFSLVVVEKTPIPMALSKKTISMVPDGGFWLGFKLRQASETI